jgi:hypothetical protein
MTNTGEKHVSTDTRNQGYFINLSIKLSNCITSSSVLTFYRCPQYNHSRKIYMSNLHSSTSKYKISQYISSAILSVLPLKLQRVKQYLQLSIHRTSNRQVWLQISGHWDTKTGDNLKSKVNIHSLGKMSDWLRKHIDPFMGSYIL